MAFGLKTLGRFLRGFRRKEDGGPTVEFVLVFFPFMVLVTSAFELGLLMTRHVMLERGLDMAVYEVRLNTGSPVDETQFKRMICNTAGILPDCMTNVRLEMRSINMRHSGSNATNSIPRVASCTNVNDPFAPARNFANGTANEMMIVRACGAFEPILPTMGLGYVLAQGTQNRYRVVSSTAFVMEPL